MTSAQTRGLRKKNNVASPEPASSRLLRDILPLPGYIPCR